MVDAAPFLCAIEDPGSVPVQNENYDASTLVGCDRFQGTGYEMTPFATFAKPRTYMNVSGGPVAGAEVRVARRRDRADRRQR